MAVPNTNTFALSDVVFEVTPLVAEPSLGDCFNVSIAGRFNPFYKGDKDRLSNFRDYGYYKTLEITSADPNNDGSFSTFTKLYDTNLTGSDSPIVDIMSKAGSYSSSTELYISLEVRNDRLGSGSGGSISSGSWPAAGGGAVDTLIADLCYSTGSYSATAYKEFEYILDMTMDENGRIFIIEGKLVSGTMYYYLHYITINYITGTFIIEDTLTLTTVTDSTKTPKLTYYENYVYVINANASNASNGIRSFYVNPSTDTITYSNYFSRANVEADTIYAIEGRLFHNGCLGLYATMLYMIDISTPGSMVFIDSITTDKMVKSICGNGSGEIFCLEYGEHTVNYMITNSLESPIVAEAIDISTNTLISDSIITLENSFQLNTLGNPTTEYMLFFRISRNSNTGIILATSTMHGYGLIPGSYTKAYSISSIIHNSEYDLIEKPEVDGAAPSASYYSGHPTKYYLIGIGSIDSINSYGMVTLNSEANTYHRGVVKMI